MKITLYILFILLLNLIFYADIHAQPAKKQVYVFELKREVGPAAWRTTRRAFDEAKAVNADVILVHMNTYGGALNYADSIRTRLLESDIKTIVFIDNNAASAGALISLACDKIYMRKGASIGAASVVNPNGEIMPEKYQSYMRGLMRSTAEAKGRDPKLAEAFVDPDIDLPGIKPKGKVLTFTTAEAVKNGFCNGVAESREAVLKAEGFTDYEVTEHRQTWVDTAINFLINPAVSGLLIILIIGGIYFEMQSPGIGFALLVAIIGAMLFFAPLYLEGLASNWEIALFIVGVILIGLEIFVIPGFGVAGITGIIFIVCGLAFSLVMNNFFDFTVNGSERLAGSFILVLISTVLSIVLCVVFGKAILKTNVFQRLVLQDEQRSQMGYSTSQVKPELINRLGKSKTDLRPSGKIEVDGKWYDAVALDGFIEKDSEVLVERQENYNVFVRKTGV